MRWRGASPLVAPSVYVYIHSMNGGPLVLSKASGVPFYRQLRDELADRIRSGLLPAGFSLPSIREMAVQVSVSVITVKSAYEDLERDGLIVSLQGRGTFVAERAGAASQKHAIEVVGTELRTLAQRAARMGVDRDTFRKLAEDAGRKCIKNKESS